MDFLFFNSIRLFLVRLGKTTYYCDFHNECLFQINFFSSAIYICKSAMWKSKWSPVYFHRLLFVTWAVELWTSWVKAHLTAPCTHHGCTLWFLHCLQKSRIPAVPALQPTGESFVLHFTVASHHNSKWRCPPMVQPCPCSFLLGLSTIQPLNIGDAWGNELFCGCWCSGGWTAPNSYAFLHKDSEHCAHQHIKLCSSFIIVILGIKTFYLFQLGIYCVSFSVGQLAG